MTKIDEPKPNRKTKNVTEVWVRSVFFTRKEWIVEGQYRKETMIVDVCGLCDGETVGIC